MLEGGGGSCFVLTLDTVRQGACSEGVHVWQSTITGRVIEQKPRAGEKVESRTRDRELSNFNVQPTPPAESIAKPSLVSQRTHDVRAPFENTPHADSSRQAVGLLSYGRTRNVSPVDLQEGWARGPAPCCVVTKGLTAYPHTGIMIRELRGHTTSAKCAHWSLVLVGEQ